MRKLPLALSVLGLLLGACQGQSLSSSNDLSSDSSSVKDETGTYSVKANPLEGASVSFEKEKYAPGTTVRFSVSFAKDDRAVERLEPASLCFKEEKEGTYSFEMPSHDVTIDVHARYVKGDTGSLIRVVNKDNVASGLSLQEGSTYLLGQELSFSFSSSVDISRLRLSWNDQNVSLFSENGKITAKVTPTSLEGTLYIAENPVNTSANGHVVTLAQFDQGAMAFGFENGAKYVSLSGYLYRRPGYQIRSFRYRYEGENDWHALPYDTLTDDTLFSFSLYGFQKNVELALSTEKTGYFAISFSGDEHVSVAGKKEYATPGDEVSFPIIQGEEGYSILDYALTGLEEGSYSKSLSSLSFTMPKNPVRISFDVARNGGIHIAEDDHVTGFRILNSIDLSAAEDITNAPAGSTFYVIVYSIEGTLPLYGFLGGETYVAKTLEATGDRYFEFVMPSGATDATISFEMQKAYGIKVTNDDEKGNVRPVQEKAAPGELVTLIVYPKTRYVKLKSLTCLEDPSLAIAFDNSMAVFKMPSFNVTIVPTFEALETTDLTVSLASNTKITSFKVVGEQSLLEMNPAHPSGTYIVGERLSISVDLPDSSYDATLVVEGSFGTKRYASTTREGEMIAFDYLTLEEGTTKLSFEEKPIHALGVTLVNEVGASLSYKINNKEASSLEGNVYLGDNFAIVIENQYENGMIYSVRVIDDATGKELSLSYFQTGTTYFEAYEPKGAFTVKIEAVQGYSVKAELNGFGGDVSVSEADKPNSEYIGSYVLPNTSLLLTISFGSVNCDYSVSIGGEVVHTGTVYRYGMGSYNFVATGDVLITVTPK